VRIELPYEKSLINTVRNVKLGDFIEKTDIPALHAQLL